MMGAIDGFSIGLHTFTHKVHSPSFVGTHHVQDSVGLNMSCGASTIAACMEEISKKHFIKLLPGFYKKSHIHWLLCQIIFKSITGKINFATHLAMLCLETPDFIRPLIGHVTNGRENL